MQYQPFFTLASVGLNDSRIDFTFIYNLTVKD
jgi:hypothetical protein